MDRPTLTKLAKEFGVSITTISNAFRRPDQLSAELRERILERAHGLSFYGPDPAGRLLRTGRSSLIGLGLFHDTHQALGDPHINNVIRGVATVLDSHGLGLVLLPRFGRRGPNRDPVPFPVDGLIIYSPFLDHEFVERLGKRHVPMLSIDTRHPSLSSVTIDDRVGARSAAEHLLELGHRDIAILSFDLPDDALDLLETLDDSELAARSITLRRLAGYRDALLSAGVDFDSVPILEANQEEAAVLAAGRHLERARSAPTALLCMSDQLALGALRALVAGGLEVPGDVSVVGFDDIPAASGCRPPLTTVRQDAFRKGQAAAEAVLQPREELLSVELPVEFVVRGSCGSPRGS